MIPNVNIDKVRALSWTGGIFLLILSTWAFIHYELSSTNAKLLKAIGLCITVFTLPTVLAYLKFGFHRARERWRLARDANYQVTVFVSRSSLEAPKETLASIETELKDRDTYDAVVHDEFSTGPGLTVVHSSYHNLFIRVLKSGRLAISGDSHRLDDLVNVIDNVESLSLTRASVNPFVSLEPVRGGPRTVLTVCLVVLVLLGTGSIAGAAYPSNAYNPVEKTILVSFDVRSDIDPTMTQTDLKIAKSAFLVQVLDEKSVELMMVNSTDQRIHHAKAAVIISGDARYLLRDVRRSSLSAKELKRTNRIEANLRKEEQEVASVIAELMEQSNVRETKVLSHAQEELRTLGNTSVLPA